MTEHLEKTLNRYVIATFDNPTNYLVVQGGQQYAFIDNITKATKFTSLDVASIIHNTCSRIYQFDLVILPMQIKYILLEE